MKVLVILGHPNPGESFNRAIAETAGRVLRELGHEPVLRDLYAEGFDPVMPMGEEKLPIEELPESIRREIDAVRGAGGFGPFQRPVPFSRESGRFDKRAHFQ